MTANPLMETSTETVSTLIATQEITISSSQSNSGANDRIDYIEMASRNLQGCNMFKCTVNINFAQKNKKKPVPSTCTYLKLCFNK